MTQCKNQSDFQRLIPPEGIRERYQGCLLGGAVGDALGAPVEFMRRSEILHRFGQQGITSFVPAYGKLGAITDDTQMTLFTADGALRDHLQGVRRVICNPNTAIHHAYLRWLHTQEDRELPGQDLLLDGWLIQHNELFARRAPGRTCIQALRSNLIHGQAARNDSKGCGGVMRVAPIGMLSHSLTLGRPSFRSSQFQRAFDLGCDAAAITHGHPTGFLTAGVMSALVFELLDGADLSSALDQVTHLLIQRDWHEETLNALQRAQSLYEANTDPDDAVRQLGQGWIAEEALAIGVYCSLKAENLEAAVIMAVNHDGDSDSTGLIAGHLMGAMQGRSAIPERWLAPLELREVLVEMADDLATAGSWPLDGRDSCAAADYYLLRYPGNQACRTEESRATNKSGEARRR